MKKLKVSSYESSLIVLCSPLLDDEELMLPNLDQEWKNWLSLAVLNRIETQVFNSLTRRNIAVPKNVMQALAERAHTVIEQNRKRRTEAKLLFATLEKERIPFIVLKGNALAQEIYQDLDYKQMNDFDLLFQPKDLDKLEIIYKKMDYLSAASLDPKFRKQEKYSHHWPPFFSRNMHLFLGTHWNLVSPFSKVKIPDEALWKNVESFTFDGQNLQRLGKENFLLHLCVHLSPYKLGLKELADLYNFIFYFEKQIRWDDFIKLVQGTNAEDSTYRAFSILQSLFQSAIIDKVISAIESTVSKSIRSEVRVRTQPPIKALYIRTGHVSKIEKNFGFFSLSDKPSEKAYFLFKMWKNYLWAPWEECFRLCHEIPNPSLLKRLVYSCRSIREINRSFITDLGLKVYVLVTLQHHIELTKAIFNKLIGKPCEGIAQKANKLGLALTDLKNLSQVE